MVGAGNPMANMQPMGILASSQPLVDAVANDAINPQGGTALSMADGGIAKFQNGGFYQHGTAWKPSPSPQVEVPIKVPSLTFAYEGDVPPSPEGPTVELIPTRLEDSISAPPSPFAKTHTSESIQLMEIETPSARVDRMFPAAAGPGGLTHEKRHPDAPSGVVPRGIAKAGSFFESALESVGFGLLTDIQSIIDVGFSAESDPESESYIPNLGIGERKTIAHLIARAPKALHQEIMDIGKSLVSQKDYKLPYYAENISDPEIAGRGGLAFNPLAQDIAQALHEKHERPGIDRVRAKQAAIKSSRALRFGQTEPITVAEALEQARPQDLPTEEWGFSNLEAMKEEHLARLRDASDDPTRTPGGGYPGYTKAVDRVAEIIQNLQGSGLPSSYTDELLRDLQKPEVDQSEISAAEMAHRAVSADGPRELGMYPEKYPGSDALLTAETAVVGDADADETAVAAVVAEREPAESVAGERPSEVAEPSISTSVPPGQTPREVRESERVAAALDVKDIFAADTSADQKDAQDSLQKYIDRFKSAVPGYEGKSEWEKGMDIVKMGMAIAAGESQHAITNIAKGVMATIDNFTSDDKERRAYERQVGLSAGKYALDSVERDRVRRDALLKEGRVLTQAIALEDFVDPQGNEIKKGEAYPVTRTQIDQGIFQSLPLTYTNVFIENARSIKAFEAAQATAAANLRKERIIGYEEADTINKRLRGAREDFVHAEAGEALLSGVVEQLLINPDDITGAEGAAKKLWGEVLNVIGQGEDKSPVYKTRELLELDMKMAFQKLIPVALRNIQAGNSISDRDVRNLANAYIAGGFIDQNKDGTFRVNSELAGKNPEVLVRQLQQTIKIFRDAQQNSLITFEQELYNLSQAEAGRHDIRYFEPELKRMAPAIEAYRGAREGQTRGETSPATRMKAPSVLQVSDYFDLATGKSIKPIPRWEEEG